MRNSIFIILLLFFENLYAENLSIEANNISLNKQDNTSIFENQVIVKTKGKVIYSEYAKYNKKKGLLILNKNIIIFDEKKNEIKADYAEYLENEEIIYTKGQTEVKTREGYLLAGKDLFFDNKKKVIKSDQNSILQDQDNNKIFLENFEYSINSNLFKSIGLIKIHDNKKNIYKFSQVYIDTKKREIIGTDSKVFLNNVDFKLNEKNNPRVFSNSVNINSEKSTFNKSIFTLCQFRENDDCPPWTIQSKKMTHDNVKKTIFYDNAVVKVYDFPIFYFPKLSHPDPTVDRRSGFLIPSLYDTKNLGSGVSIPYFFDLGIDKNFTLTNRLHVAENPLFLGEYHQAFLNSSLLADFGYTEGYKKSSATKKSGEKSHFFAKFVKNFTDNSDYENSFEINLQEVSNDKYLKLYKIDSNIVDYNTQTLENSINFTQEREDLFFGFSASVYETIKSDYNDKYEFILPELTLDKNLLSDDQLGSLELQTNYRAHNYDTNKLTNFLVNDFNYESNDNLFNNFISTKILANVKNINYESRNVDIYKNDPTSEIFGSIGFLSEVNLEKFDNDTRHLLKPKFLMRLSPGSMRKESGNSRLTPSSAFKLNRIDNINNYETGISSTLGFEYRVKRNDMTKFDFSLAQIINEKENKKMSDKSSLNEKLSDLVGSSNFIVNENLNLNYDFSIDQNYNDLNYNEVGATYDNGTLHMNFNYLSESKHIGDQDYFKTQLSLKNEDKGLLSFSTKRNLVTDSSEFYNLSYEYINDCLRAGLVYRREFYNDSELEPEDSLMFKLTLVPFGSLDSPKLD
tara:strand:- start:2116 stop:4506 length:2391 start_codon:yes stop_codon:yes gene_type:complete